MERKELPWYPMDKIERLTLFLNGLNKLCQETGVAIDTDNGENEFDIYTRTKLPIQFEIIWEDEYSFRLRGTNE